MARRRTLGKMLDEAIITKEWNRSDLASKMNVHRSQVTKWINEDNFNAKTAIRLSHALDIDPEPFIDEIVKRYMDDVRREHRV
jgi:plasmid maintenance system antidote protein VapI